MQELNYLFGDFFGITLIGANIDGFVHGDKLNVMMDSVRDLRVRDRNSGAFAHFPDCPRLENLELCDYSSMCFNMFRAPNLKNVFFNDCELYMMDVFGGMFGLKIIVCHNYFVARGDVHCMGRIHTLDTLILNNCEMEHIIWKDELIKLRRLELRKTQTHDVENYVIPRCQNLRHLVIDRWNSDAKLEVLYECNELRTVDIVCDNTFDLDLSRFAYLKSFIFNGRERIGMKN